MARLENYLVEGKGNIKMGDWVSGTHHGGMYSSRVSGVYITQTSSEWHLIATVIKKYGKSTDFNKKVYLQVGNPIEKEKGKPPSALLSFAKKHPYWKKIDESKSMSQNLINNFYSKVSKMSSNVLKYQMRVGWYEFVDRVRERGNEDKTLHFINSTFHVNLKSLDDVNLEKMKISLPGLGEAVDVNSIYQIVVKLQEFTTLLGFSALFFAALVLKELSKD